MLSLQQTLMQVASRKEELALAGIHVIRAHWPQVGGLWLVYLPRLQFCFYLFVGF